MVDEKQILERFQGDVRDAIVDCIKTLNEFGFFVALVEDNKRRIVDSFEMQEETALVQQVREMRQENRVLLALASLFPPQTKDMRNA